MKELFIRPKGISTRRLIACMILWCVTALLVSGGVYSLYLSSTSPVFSAGDVEQYGDAHPGGLLSIHVNMHRTRECPVDMGVYLQRMSELNGELVTQKVLLDSSTTSALDETGSALSEVILSWILPRNIPIGNWVLQIKAIDRCGALDILFPQGRQMEANILISQPPAPHTP